ncbi:Uncharacterised protein [Mycobacteroides abscessus subsp. abscessus]|nr:Uncharacterised protein [Mycobacteroides abscessus subsp. abscessus]
MGGRRTILCQQTGPDTGQRTANPAGAPFSIGTGGKCDDGFGGPVALDGRMLGKSA